MQSRLIVRNFGPIEYVDLDLRNVNVFIGPQASGKSALAKLYTIFKAPRKFLKDVKDDTIKQTVSIANPFFKEVLEEYNIASFIKSDTGIEFESELHSLIYDGKEITYVPKLLKRIQKLEKLKNDFPIKKGSIKKEIIDLSKDFFLFQFEIDDILKDKEDDFMSIEEYTFDKLDIDTFQSILEVIKNIEMHLSTNAALYIPSERNFINIVKNASLNLLLNKVPIPKHILSFGAELEKANIKKIDLGFLNENITYKNIKGEDRIFTNNKHSIKLTEAASGIQSVLPILIPILSRNSLSYQRSFVIEEPELNLFPIAQYKLIKLLESNRDEPDWEDYGAIHTYTTHSPYILSSFNNLLYANKVIKSLKEKYKTASVISREYEKIEKQVGEIITRDIDPKTFTAYQISNGGAESIFDREKGLIIDNYIDEASDTMADDFDALMNLMK